jgi:hypothetical protein
LKDLAKGNERATSQFFAAIIELETSQFSVTDEVLGTHTRTAHQ